MQTQPSPPSMIQRRREEQYKTPELVAGLARVSLQTYKRAEKDPTSVRYSTLLQICEVLELDIQNVLEDARREKG